MISVLVPTRQRPERFAEMLASLERTQTTGTVEVVAYLDDDDPTFDAYPSSTAYRYRPIALSYIRGRLDTPLSDLWNRCYEAAMGDVLMLGADDLIFQTLGWDSDIERAFAEVPDRILFAWCQDGTIHDPIGTHPFVSRRWCEIVGRFTAPYFEAWYADSWLLDVALKVRRLRYLHRHRIVHQHIDYRTASDDDTYQFRRALRPEGQPRMSDRPEWLRTEDERMAEARMLWANMDASLQLHPPAEFDHVYLQHGYAVDNVLWRAS